MLLSPTLTHSLSVLLCAHKLKGSFHPRVGWGTPWFSTSRPAAPSSNSAIPAARARNSVRPLCGTTPTLWHIQTSLLPWDREKNLPSTCQHEQQCTWILENSVFFNSLPSQCLRLWGNPAHRPLYLPDPVPECNFSSFCSYSFLAHLIVLLVLIIWS